MGCLWIAKNGTIRRASRRHSVLAGLPLGSKEPNHPPGKPAGFVYNNQPGGPIHENVACLPDRRVCCHPRDFRVRRRRQDLPRGAAQVDITPTVFPVINSGGFLERMADRAHDRLMSRALILDDGASRIALVVVDNLMMTQEFLDEVKQQASQATGIPTEHMLISATHTHSAPSVMGALGSRADAAYTQFLPGQIVKSIVLAAEKLEPARVGWASIQDYAHNHCRRWVYRPDRMPNDPFGNRTVRAMMHPGHQSPNHIGPSGPADQSLTLLSVQSPDGRPIAVLGNYAMHYKGSPAVSSDFCGRFGDAFAALIGADAASPAFVGMMSQGTSGDSMWMDYAKPANDPGLDGYTLAMAQVAREVHQKIAYQDWVPLAMAESRLTLARRAPDAERLAWAKEVAAKIQDRLPQNQPEVYALEALYLHEQPEVEIKLQAIRIGDLGITALPNEVYGITGLKLKAQSPLEHTLNIELANGAFGYIPPPEQHFLGGYTTWPARTAGLEVDAEPKIVEQLLKLLEQVSGKPRRRANRPRMITSARSSDPNRMPSGDWTSWRARSRAMRPATTVPPSTSWVWPSTCQAAARTIWNSPNRRPTAACRSRAVVSRRSHRTGPAPTALNSGSGTVCLPTLDLFAAVCLPWDGREAGVCPRTSCRFPARQPAAAFCDSTTAWARNSPAIRRCGCSRGTTWCWSATAAP